MGNGVGGIPKPKPKLNLNLNLKKQTDLDHVEDGVGGIPVSTAAGLQPWVPEDSKKIVQCHELFLRPEMQRAKETDTTDFGLVR